MNQDGRSIKSQKVMNKNLQKAKEKSYISAGTLASLRNKRTLLKKNYNQNPRCIPSVQENLHIRKQNSNNISAGSLFPEAQTVDAQVHQVFPDSATPASQAPHEQLQQKSQLPIAPISGEVQERIQQHSQDSTNLEAVDQSEEPVPSTNKKKRGATQMQAVHGRSERKLIVLNELGQPIGPTKEVVKELGSFLGTLSRNGSFCPLNVLRWDKLTTHADMWSYIKEKYIIPPEGKKWALKKISADWRGYKTRLKNNHFYAYSTNEIRWEKRPKYTVPDSIFKDMLKHWNSEEAKNEANTNKENRKKLKFPHTAGKTSFAVIREELKKTNPEAMSRKNLFVVNRKRNPEKIYKESFEDLAAKIDEMENIETQEEGDDNEPVDAFDRVMGGDHPGRVRLYGHGVTKTLLKQIAAGSGNSSTSTDDEMVMKGLEDLEDRIAQRMQEKFNVQKATIERDVTMNIITQLQRLNPGLAIDPDMLRSIIPQSGDQNTV